ncbi:15838_t:CDS:2 [Dentiscutata erythropus]|uniref:15838_t:CDS:1 n=1 Tax=Dentiscutata erythropus TaxID=1348616 RepID=A0A9N9IRJ9_9GLOM|nr:15838_t:CDS:2 [Dentiscutata erythropus]
MHAPSSKPLEIFSTGSFDTLKREGCYYLDKTHFIPKIEALRAPAILSLRPRRFGKTLFLSTLSSYYDIKNKGERFNQLFGDLFIGENPTNLASSYLVLKLNFAGLRTNETYDIFNVDFHESLNRFMSIFMNRYRYELGDYFQAVDENKSALRNFMMLLEAVQLSDHKLYVFIDEYDAGMNEALKNETILQPLIAHHEKKSNPSKTRIEAMDSSFKQFYSRLKTACDEGIARVFQTGVTPVVMSEFTSGFNISKDLALRKEFWDLYGFKKSEIEHLLDNALGLSSDVKGGILKWLKEENDGYFFNPDQTEGIFNTARVLYCIEMLMERKTILTNDDYQDTSATIKKLLRFPSDPHTLPSQTTLDLIVNNPLGKFVLTEVLNQHSLELKTDIEQRFRLTNIRELATDRTPLLSFMFYTGALTYKPGSLKYELQIPNRIAKREFIAEALKIYDWKEEDLMSTLLKPLKDNSVKHSNEEALKQAFMDALILTLHADIEPEFRVHTQNLSRKAIDLVKTSTGRRIAIEFDNIKTECVKLNGVTNSWQELTQVSRLLSEKSDEEILSLEISDKYRPKQKTVREVLEHKIKVKKNEYLMPLKERNDAELSCMFIVLRVGLHRLISRRAYCIDE